MWFEKENSTSKDYSSEELNKLFNGSKRDRELAFTYVYNKHSNRLYAYCIRITSSRQDADDIFQETFTRFINSHNDDIEFNNIGSYLIKIARNLELNFKRSKKNFHLNIEDYDHLLQIDEKDKYEKKEEMEIIAKALDLLDFPFKEIFVLRQYHNMSYEDIAEITNEKMHVLRNRYFKAKEKLKEILDPILNEKIK